MCAKKESVCDDAGLIYADAEPICARGELMIAVEKSIGLYRQPALLDDVPARVH